MLRLVVHLGIFLASVFVLVYFYFRKQYNYWKNRNIPFEKPSFPFGSFKPVLKKSYGVVVRDYYLKHRNKKFVGLWMFHRPTLLINDLDLVKDILVKDFMSFHDHGIYHDAKVDPLSANLFAIEGSKWRNIRAKLTPTFTSGKMKMMFPTIRKCSNELKETLKREEGMIEMKDIIARFATDVIASCAFGIEANSLKNPDAIFRTMGRKIFEPTWEMYVRNLGSFLVPSLGKLLKLRTTPKKVADFFIGAMRDTIKFRESNGVKRNDFLQLLMQLMSKGYVEDADSRSDAEIDKTKFTFEEAVAEAFIFFVGGFETSSTTMHFLLYELAMNPDIQDRLREEIQEELRKTNGEMTYEGIHGMEYMGRVIQETLRRHPPSTFLVRACTKPYNIPGTDIILEKDTSILIPNFGYQMDENYYPNPEKFDPDRFLEENKSTRNPYSYLPFGEGPRICIGQRFAMMQVRAALVTVVANFRISRVEGKTPSTMEYDPKVFILAPKEDISLRITSIN